MFVRLQPAGARSIGKSKSRVKRERGICCRVESTLSVESNNSDRPAGETVAVQPKQQEGEGKPSSPIAGLRQ
jgi:hypothetical protein